MNTISHVFQSAWTEPFGWALVHSLWQSLICIACVIVALRLIPSKYSDARYYVAGAGLALVPILSIVTFVHVSSLFAAASSSGGESLYQNISFLENPTAGMPAQVLLAELVHFIQSNLPSIVLVWGLGAMLFSLRFMGGWWYVNRLRENCIQIDDSWAERFYHLAAKLRVKHLVVLAESTRIQAPIVIGYLKPMVLIPVGMWSGLSIDQLESVIAHELMHIKRGDYLVNVIQSFLEGLYFFNPSVWILSGIVRREREHCCDDEVVRLIGNPLVYAQALATLEEIRLSKSGLSVALADDKRELLNRIKRIMEKSVHRYSNRERVIPAVLLAILLVCASWITMQPATPNEGDVIQEGKATIVLSDTTKKNRNAKQRRGKAVDHMLPVFPDDEINEEVDVTVELDGPPMPIQPVFAMPDIDVVPDIDAAPDIDIVLAPMANFSFHLDSIPRPNGSIGVFPDWAEFSASFEDTFKENFGEFYRLHEQELKNMMAKMEFKFDHQFSEEWVENMRRDADRQQENVMRQAEKLAMNREFSLQNEESLKKLEAEMREWEGAHAAEMEKLKKEAEAMEGSLKAFEKQLNAQLIKDGYLKEGEEATSINIHDGTVEINGKSIKPVDREKYKALVDQLSHSRSDLEFRHSNHEGRKE